MQFRWFARQLRPLLRAYAVSVSLIVLSSLMFLLDPLLIKWLIDRILPKKDFHLLFLAAAGFFGIYVCRLVLSALAGVVSFRTVQDLVFRIRLSILEQINRLSTDYHESTPVGEKLYRMEQDVDQVAELGSSLLPYALQTTFNAIFVVATMFILDFKLTCMVLPLVPLFFVFRRYFDKRLRGASDSAQRQSSRESSFLQEHLASVVQIQLLHQERSQTKAFLERAAARVEALNHRNLIEILFRTSYMAVIALGTVAYVVFTWRLWEATEKTAQAAGKSAAAATEAALAAKKSADMAAALHRPFMGLVKVTLKTGWGTDLWVIVLAIKNYGTLPAMNVAAMIEFFTGNTRLTQITEPAAVQIFPSAEIESIVRLSMPTHRVQIQQGIEKLRIEVRIPYQAEDGRQFEYSAEVSYTQDGSFAIQKSETRAR